VGADGRGAGAKEAADLAGLAECDVIDGDGGGLWGFGSVAASHLLVKQVSGVYI
jgi:hypothetical protein